MSLAVRSGVNLVGSRFVTVRFDGAVDMEMRWPFSASQRGSPLGVGGLGWGFITDLAAGYTGDNAYVGLRRGTVTIHVSLPPKRLDRFEILVEGDGDGPCGVGDFHWWTRTKPPAHDGDDPVWGRWRLI